MEVILNHKSWHYKLQKFTFRKRTPELNNLCPYFWITIFCLIAFPIMILINPIRWIIIWYDYKYLQPKFEAWLESIKEPKDVFILYSYPKRIIRKRPFTFKWWGIGRGELFNVWINKIFNGEWTKELDELIDKGRDEYNKEAELKEEEEILKEMEKRRSRREHKFDWVTPLVLITKFVVNLALTIGLIYLFSFFIIIFIAEFTVQGLLHFLKVGSVIILFLLLFVLIVISLIKIKFFIWLVKLIIESLYIFIQYFKAIKNGICPAINWKE